MGKIRARFQDYGIRMTVSWYLIIEFRDSSFDLALVSNLVTLKL
jgi:hypothetical protein